MKILGVIMECNPFHNGHSYFLKRAKELCSADYCIAVMSGDYVQRGFPACFPKELRTEVLLKNGADLVLELPVAFSTGSAEYFARAGVALLDKLGCVDYLCFGSECGDIELFTEIAGLLESMEGSAFSDALASKLKEGKSFPSARYEALSSIPTYEKYLPLLKSPNNILGVEYCRALLARNSSIVPLTFRRKGSGYHDLDASNTEFASASGLRNAFIKETSEKNTANNNVIENADFWQHVPENCQSLYLNALKSHACITADDFSTVLARQLLFSDINKLASYQDVSVDLAEKFSASGTKQAFFTEYCDTLKPKNYTHTRISRSLLHIILDITKEDVEKQIAMDHVTYARILGFRKDASELLSFIKKLTSIPLLSKLADAENILNEDSFAQLQQTLTASHLYNSVLSHKTRGKMQHEYEKQIVIV